MLKQTKILWLLICIGLLTLAIGCGANGEPELSSADFTGTYLPSTAPVPDFELESVAGPVKLSDYRGEYVVIYFGYTFCPDFCPITLSTMSNVRENLGEAGDQLNVIMVTVDPERDTAELLDEYVTYFDPSYVGLTGTIEEIEQAGAPFGLFMERGVEAENDDYYLVNHTTRTYLINPEGVSVLSWRHETTPDEITSDIQLIIESDA